MFIRISIADAPLLSSTPSKREEYEEARSLVYHHQMSMNHELRIQDHELNYEMQNAMDHEMRLEFSHVMCPAKYHGTGHGNYS